MKIGIDGSLIFVSNGIPLPEPNAKYGFGATLRAAVLDYEQQYGKGSAVSAKPFIDLFDLNFLDFKKATDTVRMKPPTSEDSEPNYRGAKGAFAIDVLDHGFVVLHNLSGPTRRPDAPFDAHDTDPANTARMSFGQMNSGRTEEMDLKLCEYLMKNRHTTPFEMIECWIEMKMPIFVARQFVRHRTATINEISGRYVTLPRQWYIPEVVGGKAANAKQGQEDTLDADKQELFKLHLSDHCERGYNDYLHHMSNGVAPEHARMFLSLNHYTHWMWKQDLHNIMHFLSLRDHSHAQIESQQYAKAITQMLRKYLPNSMALYDENRRIK